LPTVLRSAIMKRKCLHMTLILEQSGSMSSARKQKVSGSSQNPSSATTGRPCRRVRQRDRGKYETISLKLYEQILRRALNRLRKTLGTGTRRELSCGGSFSTVAIVLMSSGSCRLL
jgi:hypothetical protein